MLAITSDVRVARRLALEWGVIPRIEVPPESLDETLRIATARLAREKLCKTGEAFAMVVGWPTSGLTNSVKLHRLYPRALRCTRSRSWQICPNISDDIESSDFSALARWATSTSRMTPTWIGPSR